MTYGTLPDDLGLIDLSPVEMMFWLYCPIGTPSEYIRLPDNLKQFSPLVKAAMRHEDTVNYGFLEDAYIYITAKTLWVAGDYIGNRPGWHSDGFGTTDINYVWWDRAPTEFIQGKFELPAGCEESLQVMDAIGYAAELDEKLITYPDKHLLRLDERVIHRAPAAFDAGMRTFVKVSMSHDLYDLVGNSINHNLPLGEPTVMRAETRNHPQSRMN